MFRLNRFKGVDGVLLVQVLSWVSDYEKPLNQVFRKVRPKWIAVTALFYEGISIVIQQLLRTRSGGQCHGIPTHYRDSTNSFKQMGIKSRHNHLISTLISMLLQILTQCLPIQ